MWEGGAKSSRMSFFRGVKVRVDEKWTWGEGGSKKTENEWTSFVHGLLCNHSDLLDTDGSGMRCEKVLVVV